ncbi:MAG: type I glyceraldehyde-3-phosphate dehydrogenase [Bacteroidales bacterium]|nr:type I glyceraldehyde-3-phosphate dehydrogenase [Bacteroidales bacterium]
MSIRIGINGLGRIGKLVLRHSFKYPDIEVVAVNDLMDIRTMMHLIKYDTVHGRIEKPVKIGDDNSISVNGSSFKVYAQPKPALIPWENHNLDYVIESSGIFTSYSELKQHLRPGIKKVILSCPATDKLDKNIVISVNEKELTSTDRIISNTSCTTNCIAPLLKILHDNFYIDKAFINTVHPYTNNQRIIDAPHKDLRRARAAAANIIPTTTSAIKAVENILPHLKGNFDGIATRVPLVDGSLIELTAVFKNTVTVQSINEAVRKAADNEFSGILEYTDDPIVSSDIINNPHSGIFDGLSTKVLGPNFAQLIIWYDNEYAYSKRIVDLIMWSAKVDGVI